MKKILVLENDIITEGVSSLFNKYKSVFENCKRKNHPCVIGKNDEDFNLIDDLHNFDRYELLELLFSHEDILTFSVFSGASSRQLINLLIATGVNYDGEEKKNLYSPMDDFILNPIYDAHNLISSSRNYHNFLRGLYKVNIYVGAEAKLIKPLENMFK